jgi:hypothetical protein
MRYLRFALIGLVALTVDVEPDGISRLVVNFLPPRGGDFVSGYETGTGTAAADVAVTTASLDLLWRIQGRARYA